MIEQNEGRKPVIHVVEDDASARAGVARLLRFAGYDVRTYESGSELLLHSLEDAPGCLLLDVKLPGVNGLDLHVALARKVKALPVVFLTGRGDITMGVRAMKSGAVDFLTKPVKRETLIGAIEAALQRDAHNRARRAYLDDLHARYDTLTSRERDVFARVVEGQLNKTIACELGMSLRTVKAHRARVMEKLQASSIVDLVRLAGELDPQRL